MKKVLLLAAMAMACGGAKPKPGGGASGGGGGAPQWVQQGTGAFNVESGKRFQGVGVVDNVKDPKARRDAADQRAREELGQVMDLFYRSVAKGGESTSDDVAAVGKQAVAQAARIEDHWVTADGAESALDVLNLADFKAAAANASGDDKAKRDIANNADRAFDQMAR